MSVIELLQRIPGGYWAVLAGFTLAWVSARLVDKSLRGQVTDRLWSGLVILLLSMRYSGLLLHPNWLFHLNLAMLPGIPVPNGWVAAVGLCLLYFAISLVKMRNVSGFEGALTAAVLAGLTGFYATRALLDPGWIGLEEALSAWVMGILFILGRFLPLFAPAHRVWGVAGLAVLLLERVAPSPLYLGLSLEQWIALVMLLISLGDEAWRDLHETQRNIPF